MEIGEGLKALRLQKNLTQEELGERTDLTKGYISQLENDLSSPSLDTFLQILDVLGTTAKDFFKAETDEVIEVMEPTGMVEACNEADGWATKWLVAHSNDHEMEPVTIQLASKGETKHYAPSKAETFGYVLAGEVTVCVGNVEKSVLEGSTFYYVADREHYLKNKTESLAKVLLVVTHSYL